MDIENICILLMVFLWGVFFGSFFQKRLNKNDISDRGLPLPPPPPDPNKTGRGTLKVG